MVGVGVLSCGGSGGLLSYGGSGGVAVPFGEQVKGTMLIDHQ